MQAHRSYLFAPGNHPRKVEKVFECGADGQLTHFYSVCAFGPDGGRMMDLLSPVWNYFDLTPDGRGEFFPSREY